MTLVGQVVLLVIAGVVVVGAVFALVLSHQGEDE